MSRGNTVMFIAFGDVIDDPSVSVSLKSEARDSGPKSITNEWVAGPRIFIQETDLVSFDVEVITKSTLTTLFAKVQLSYNGLSWRDMHAGEALSVVGVAPNEELHSELHPLVRPYTIPGDNSGFFMNYELRSVFCRLLLKGDVTAAPSEVIARAGI